MKNISNVAVHVVYEQTVITDAVALILNGIGLKMLLSQSEDNIGFRKENKPSQIFVLLCLSLTISACVFFVAFPDKVDPEQLGFLMAVEFSSVLTVGCIMQCHTPIAMIQKQHFFGEDSSRRRSTNSVALLDVLSDADGLKLFAAHCVKEYNIENMLFILELNQWRKLVLDQLADVMDGGGGMRTAMAVLNLPISSIPTSLLITKYGVESNETEPVLLVMRWRMVEMCFVELYKKYVDWSSADWEINISSSNRHILQALCKKVCGEHNSVQTLRKMIEATNNAEKNVLANLDDAFARYKATTEHREWLKQR